MQIITLTMPSTCRLHPLGNNDQQENLWETELWANVPKDQG